MQKWKAFLAAFLVFCVTVCGCHLALFSGAHMKNPDFAMWPDEKKSKSRAALTENMEAGTLPVFGSSEFQHGTNTAYHPEHMFGNTDFHPMLIGAGYYQCLSHAVTLASIADSMPVKAAVLFVSPQWFRKTGVVDKAFASRFSESHYIGMLENASLTEQTRSYIEERTYTLLKPDEKTRKRIALYEKVLLGTGADKSEQMYVRFRRAFLKEKETFQTKVDAGVLGYNKKKPASKSAGTIDWQSFKKRAVQDAKKEKPNQFYINETSYRRLKPVLAKKKGKNKHAVNGYQSSPEYDDLRCFLDVCRENGIQPMLVILPVNGYYYDYTEFPKAARENYYEKIRAMAKEYGADVADFSKDEYTKHFFEDQIHIGWKGWVEINESLYQFYEREKDRQDNGISEVGASVLRTADDAVSVHHAG